MKKTTSEQMAEFVLFAFPAYWLLALLFIAVAVWKVNPFYPDLICVELIGIAVIAAAILLVKRRCWIIVPMISLGVYIFLALKNDQHFGLMFQLYGAYLILHYVICPAYIFKIRGR